MPPMAGMPNMPPGMPPMQPGMPPRGMPPMPTSAPRMPNGPPMSSGAATTAVSVSQVRPLFPAAAASQVFLARVIYRSFPLGLLI